VRMVAEHADAVRSLRAIYIDSGTRDEWFLDLGAEAFRGALAEVGATDVRFELFDATHMGIEYRYPIAIRYLAEPFKPEPMYGWRPCVDWERRHNPASAHVA